jgi:hypothetical protein
MKSIPPRFLIAIGLLLVGAPFLLNDFVKIPDSLHGVLIGFGVGLEIVGLGRMKWGKRKAC